jgi:hypothetical protein
MPSRDGRLSDFGEILSICRAALAEGGTTACDDDRSRWPPRSPGLRRLPALPAVAMPGDSCRGRPVLGLPL